MTSSHYERLHCLPFKIKLLKAHKCHPICLLKYFICQKKKQRHPESSEENLIDRGKSEPRLRHQCDNLIWQTHKSEVE